jgi:hypothetical protein
VTRETIRADALRDQRWGVTLATAERRRGGWGCRGGSHSDDAATACRTPSASAQAKRVAELYRERRTAGEENGVALGDLNDTTSSDPLSSRSSAARTSATSATTRASVAPGHLRQRDEEPQDRLI